MVLSIVAGGTLPVELQTFMSSMDALLSNVGKESMEPHWFIGDKMAADSDPSDSLPWPAQPSLELQDDNGQVQVQDQEAQENEQDDKIKEVSPPPRKKRSKSSYSSDEYEGTPVPRSRSGRRSKRSGGKSRKKQGLSKLLPDLPLVPLKVNPKPIHRPLLPREYKTVEVGVKATLYRASLEGRHLEYEFKASRGRVSLLAHFYVSFIHHSDRPISSTNSF
jgi:hypothetical protein